MVGSSPILFWTRTGTASAKIGDTTHHVSAGRALWIPAGVSHIFAADAGSVAFPILLPPIDTHERFKRVLSVTIPPQWEDWLVYQFARSLGYLHGETRAGGGLLRLLAGSPSSDDSQAHPATLPPPLPWSNPAGEVARGLLRTPGLSHDLTELATEFGVSVRTLQRQFADETGMRFAHWRTKARIAAAAAHLSDGRSVAWTAHQVGFSATSSLSHAFRQQVGLTPSEYRRQNQLPAPGAPTLQQTISDFSAHTDQPPDPPVIPAEKSWSRINTFDIVVWVYRGTATVEAANVKRQLRHGDAVLLPAGARITVTVDSGSLLLPLGVRPGAGGPVRMPLKIVHLPVESENFLLHTLVANYTSLRPRVHDPTSLVDDFLNITRQQLPPFSSDDLREITETLSLNPSDRRSLAEWARELNRSLPSLREEFIATTGETFPIWRGQLRMTIARELIDGGAPVKTVARRLGYASLSGFSRVFSNAFGMSPRAHQMRQQKYWYAEHIAQSPARKY